jgi:hypothetical protein
LASYLSNNLRSHALFFVTAAFASLAEFTVILMSCRILITQFVPWKELSWKLFILAAPSLYQASFEYQASPSQCDFTGLLSFCYERKTPNGSWNSHAGWKASALDDVVLQNMSL